MPKQARLNRIKFLYPYTIEEAAEVSGVSVRTIRNWANDGLRVMDGTRPSLIRGDDLHAYIKAKRKSRAVKTRIDTFYCVRCREAVHAAEGIADCEVKDGRANLTAFCEFCETVVRKPIAEARIPEIAGLLDLTITRS